MKVDEIAFFALFSVIISMIAVVGIISFDAVFSEEYDGERVKCIDKKNNVFEDQWCIEKKTCTHFIGLAFPRCSGVLK